ncbi:YbjN domain-containing protein [Terasakiella sp. SH-1]|uniref:YbjN domain-containing protein n=1 Tax=Terasakiella sp. SH-1 TaxID=2560057 RepID=UPI001073B350|nr:YbjN domain-containing protein [Terasakiella sp. SH-1]
MNFIQQAQTNTPNHGLDVLEQLAEQRGWILEVISNGDYVMESVGEHCTYVIQFTWSDQYQCLHVTCSMDMRLPQHSAAHVNDLLAAINAKLWIGHFAVMAGMKKPAFRHTIMMGNGGFEKATEIEEIVEIGLGECERFYAAFQFAAFNNMPGQQAMDCALMECVGQA